MDTYKLFLDYGALGVSFGIILFVITLHNNHINRFLRVIERNAQANEKLARAVQEQTETIESWGERSRDNGSGISGS